MPDALADVLTCLALIAVVLLGDYAAVLVVRAEQRQREAEESRPANSSAEPMVEQARLRCSAATVGAGAAAPASPPSAGRALGPHNQTSAGAGLSTYSTDSRRPAPAGLHSDGGAP